MKKTLAIAVLLLTSFSAFTGKSAQIYECSGLADVEKYIVGINLKTNKLTPQAVERIKFFKFKL